MTVQKLTIWQLWPAELAQAWLGIEPGDVRSGPPPADQLDFDLLAPHLADQPLYHPTT